MAKRHKTTFKFFDTAEQAKEQQENYCKLHPEYKIAFDMIYN